MIWIDPITTLVLSIYIFILRFDPTRWAHNQLRASIFHEHRIDVGT